MQVNKTLKSLIICSFLMTLGVSPVHADAAEAHYRLALQHKKKGDMDAALKEANEAVRGRKDFAAALLTRGHIYRHLNKLPQALDDYERVNKLQPDSPDGYAGAGAVLVRLERYDEAIPRLKKAISLDPKDVTSVSNLGAALRQQGHIDEAVKVYQSAVKQNPDNADLLNNLGVALRHQRKYKEAAAALRKAVALRPYDADFHLNLAITLRSAKQYKEAIGHYERALEQGLDRPSAVFDLGVCYERSGNTDKAIETYQRFAELVRAKDPDAAKEAEKRAKGLARK